MTEKNAEGGMTEERLAGVIAAAQSAGYASVMFPVSLVEQALAEIRRLSAANQDATAISEAWRKSAEGLNSALFRVGAERDALREALRPFVKHWQRFEAGDGHIAMDPNSEANIRVTVGDVRHARLALAPREPQPPSDIPRSEPAGRCGIPDRNGKPCIHSPDHDGRGHFGGFDDEPQPPAQSDYADRVAKVAADHFERVADSLIAHGFGERVAVAPAPIPTELAFAVKETPELKFGGLGQFRRAMGPEGSCLWTTSCPSCGKKVDMTHYDCPRGLAQPPARCTHGIADGVIGQCVMSEGHEGRDIFGNIPPAPQPADCGCVPYEKQCATHAGVPQPAAEGPIIKRRIEVAAQEAATEMDRLSEDCMNLRSFIEQIRNAACVGHGTDLVEFVSAMHEVYVREGRAGSQGSAVGADAKRSSAMTTDPATLEAELLRLRELLELASPAPWKWHWRADADAPGSIAWNVDSGRSAAIAMCPRYGAQQFPRDADLIVAIRNALPTLLAAFEQQRGEIERGQEHANRLLNERDWARQRIEDLEEAGAEKRAEILRLTQALQEARAQLDGGPNGPK